MLGHLEFIGNGRDLAPTAPRVKSVLALLALNANRVVSTDTLSEELWEDRPPRSAATTLQTYVYHIRRTLGGVSSEGVYGCDIVTRSPGYMLRITDGRVDAETFHEMAAEGRRMWREDRVDEAADRLRQALALWRGPALADVRAGSPLTIHAARLSEVRMRALGPRRGPHRRRAAPAARHLTTPPAGLDHGSSPAAQTGDADGPYHSWRRIRCYSAWTNSTTSSGGWRPAPTRRPPGASTAGAS